MDQIKHLFLLYQSLNKEPNPLNESVAHSTVFKANIKVMRKNKFMQKRVWNVSEITGNTKRTSDEMRAI